jgi:methylmalonyl-CoA epimerase
VTIGSSQPSRRDGPPCAPLGGGVGDVRVDHVGVVVRDFAGVRALFAQMPGARVVGPEVEQATAMEVLWVTIGDVQLQFIRPTADDTGAAAVLRERGAGVHHLGLRVADVSSALAGLRARGIPTRDRVSRPGARGARVGFVAPHAVAGAEIELVDRGARVR